MIKEGKDGHNKHSHSAKGRMEAMGATAVTGAEQCGNPMGMAL